MEFTVQQRVQRRAVMMAGASVVLGGAMSSRGAAREGAANLEVIDCHTHFYDPTRPEGVAWPGKGTSLYRTVLPQHLREQKAYRRVTGTVVVEASPRLEDNAWLLEVAKNDPFVVGVVGSLNPDDANFEIHVKRFAADPLFRGIRVSVRTVLDLLTKERHSVLRPLADHDLALDVNGGPDTPAAVAQLAKKMPSLRIVQNHIGNVKITAKEPPPEWQAGIRAAGEQPNVFCKISALVEGAAPAGQKAPEGLEFYRPYLDVVWNAFGDTRVIYGSNWPVCERAATYEVQQRISTDYAQAKGTQALEGFCAGNAKRAYKWVDRPGRR